MCGRYFIAPREKEDALDALLESLNRRAEQQVKIQGEVFPTDIVPVLAMNKQRVPDAFAMRWGYTISGGRHIINARSETAAQSPLFGEDMAQHRCLIPASCYFEWEKRGSKRIKYAIRPAEQGTLRMAGLYRVENGVPVFTILTRTPGTEIAFIHDRMPVILPRMVQLAWLTTQGDAQALLEQADTHMDCEQAEQTMMSL